MGVTYCLCLSFSFSQLIQTISAVDTDEPLVGHKFVFSISANNPNFSIVDREGKINILTKISKGIRQAEWNIYPCLAPNQSDSSDSPILLKFHNLKRF